MSIRSGWFIVFLVFYFLVELLSRCSIFEKGILESPAIIVELFISPFLSVFASCILVVCHQIHQFSSVAQSYRTLRPRESQHARPPCPLDTYMVIIFISSWWIDPLIFISSWWIDPFVIVKYSSLYLVTFFCMC